MALCSLVVNAERIVNNSSYKFAVYFILCFVQIIASSPTCRGGNLNEVPARNGDIVASQSKRHMGLASLE